MTSCSLVDRCQRIGETCSLHLSYLFSSLKIHAPHSHHWHLPNYTASHSKRLWAWCHHNTYENEQNDLQISKLWNIGISPSWRLICFWDYREQWNLQIISWTIINIIVYHCWLEARIRKVLRPAISTQVFLVFLGPRRKCWDGSHFSSKLPLHASHVALPK